MNLRVLEEEPNLREKLSKTVPVRIKFTHTHYMNEEHKNFLEKEMRDLERERENPIFRGNTP